MARKVKRNAVDRVKALAVNYHAAKAKTARGKRNINLFLTGAAAAASSSIPGFGIVAAGYAGAAVARHREAKVEAARAIKLEDDMGRRQRLEEFRAKQQQKHAKAHPGTQRDIKETGGVVKAHQRRSANGRVYWVKEHKRRVR
jgi:hypothetical protein